MPAFVENGPDIPERLLQAHEDGEVVFFCGAGISVPAGLPMFGGLVEGIYNKLDSRPHGLEEPACVKEQYDLALGMLERRWPRAEVRKTLPALLAPKWRRKHATSTHEALLQLATQPDDKVRLVTTNFDRIFGEVNQRKKLGIPAFAAPMLPVPKPSRWHGIVYLHGLLPEKPNDAELNRLVLTSGDFGLAYLTERWASRFVTELFRHYTVCFVGYGINDPVLRYMMDALSVDESMGEPRQEAFAFADFKPGQEKQRQTEWEAKGVTPLLYEVPENAKCSEDHSALHRTLREWGDTYAAGALGKKMIIATHAGKTPLTTSKADFVVGRVLWALTDDLAAEHFAEMEPAPPLDWLFAFAEQQFDRHDLQRFKIGPVDDPRNETLSFSLVDRPTSYLHSPRMQLLSRGAGESVWDNTMWCLVKWLTKHLGDSRLLLWVAENGRGITEGFRDRIRSKLSSIEKLERQGKEEELERIREEGPNAIPSASMRVLWRVLLMGNRRNSGSLRTYEWFLELSRRGMDTTLRLELVDRLRPRVALRKPIGLPRSNEALGREERISDIAEWEIVLSEGDIHSEIDLYRDSACWQEALPHLLDDFVLLLRDSTELMLQLGGAGKENDCSFVQLPSITSHPQNNDYTQWTALVWLVRDAWLATSKRDPERARQVAQSWPGSRHPIFRRLMFFAGTYSDIIAPDEALDWLLADQHKWLWSSNCKREALQLMEQLAQRLQEGRLRELEDAILKGPPSHLFSPDCATDRARVRKDRNIWLRLATLSAAGAVLEGEPAAELARLKQRYPKWKLHEDGREGFAIWSETRDGDGDKIEFADGVEPAPPTVDELAKWLHDYPNSQWGYDGGWRDRCKTHFTVALKALCKTASERDEWPPDRVSTVLQAAWNNEESLKESWPDLGEYMDDAPDHVLQEVEHELGMWMQEVAKVVGGSKPLFFRIAERLADLEYGGEIPQETNAFGRAINHPAGQVTEAILRWWYSSEPKEGGGITQEVAPLLARLCDRQQPKYRYARVILCRNLVSLFRADEAWAKSHLLPLLSWDGEQNETVDAWQGFLSSGRIYMPLMRELKGALLETSCHLDAMGRGASKEYAEMLAMTALQHDEAFSDGELEQATRMLPADAREQTVAVLVRVARGAEKKQQEYWERRLRPYLRFVWPKDRRLATKQLGEKFGMLCVTLEAVFDQVVEEVSPWLGPVEHPPFLVHKMHEKGLCGKFPDAALKFLRKIIADGARCVGQDLAECLNELAEAKPNLKSCRDFRDIRNIAERFPWRT